MDNWVSYVMIPRNWNFKHAEFQSLWLKGESKKGDKGKQIPIGKLGAGPDGYRPW